MVNRNQGAGTRILIDRLLGGVKPTVTGINRARITPWPQRWRSSVLIGRDHCAGGAGAGLGFIPLAEEHYDFALVSARKERRRCGRF